MEVFPSCIVWNQLVPVKVDFVTWETIWGRILHWITLGCLIYICLFSSECRSKRKMPSLYPHPEGILLLLDHQLLSFFFFLNVFYFLEGQDCQKNHCRRVEVQPNIKRGESEMMNPLRYFPVGRTRQHFQRIHRRTGAMLFFDEKDRNTESVSKMGVTSILVGNGLTIGALRQGLTKFSQNSASSGNTKRN
ncbi:hypothetical protein PVL29_003700 [Vitis rotundifolia]|uniref:Uncharacterized protein n=1 Tax=Vitis rotundifolia TaxID=103349 RepID=A0AA39AGA9_VITRO|nr:hypothetical protein PVL29_003700 [Vitis rotundifolia]